MIRRIMLLVPAALLVLVLAAPAAFAASPAAEACEDQGGTFTRTGPGEFTCVLPPEDTNPGNPQSDNAATPKHEQTSNTQTGQGGGVGEDRSSLTCVYNNGGKLQENRSDEGCPATQQ
jgi:hypothetical protein